MRRLLSILLLVLPFLGAACVHAQGGPPFLYRRSRTAREPSLGDQLFMGGRSLQAVTRSNGEPNWIAYIGVQLLLGHKGDD